MKGVYIEWLKSRRTKSFSIVTLLMIVATLWSIAMFMSVFSHPELKNVGTLFSNQNVNLLMLPIAVSVFVSRIVSNEREGQTFKLQATNGLGLMTIFRHKFLFTMVFFFCHVFCRNCSYLLLWKTIWYLNSYGHCRSSIFRTIIIYFRSSFYLFNVSNGSRKTRRITGFRIARRFLGIVLNPRSYGFV